LLSLFYRKEQAFKVEHLKDELALNKMFDYDFNFDDEV